VARPETRTPPPACIAGGGVGAAPGSGRARHSGGVRPLRPTPASIVLVPFMRERSARKCCHSPVLPPTTRFPRAPRGAHPPAAPAWPATRVAWDGRFVAMGIGFVRVREVEVRKRKIAPPMVARAHCASGLSGALRGRDDRGAHWNVNIGTRLPGPPVYASRELVSRAHFHLRAAVPS
jgi:hypothetical protein